MLAPAVRLEVVTGPHAGVSCEFKEHGTLVVGRGKEAQWQLVRDPFFSRLHFRIEANPPACRLLDLESRNGTFLNGQRVKDAALQDKDIVSGGETKILVSVVGAAPSPAETVDYSPIQSGAKAPETSTPIGREPSSFAQGLLGAPFPPPKVGPFQILRLIGQGGMGVVYLARHTATKEEAAVKFVLPGVAVNELAIQHFLREVSILSQLQNRRIVEYRELGVEMGRLYLVTEYLPTIDFFQVAAQWPAAERMRQACGVMCRVLEGIDYAHQKGFVHRDIKPSNVLIFRRDNRLSAKIADFGLAKNYQDAGFSLLSRLEEVKGTFAYMPPEQLVDCKHAKPANDIYSCGATLYMLLTGKTPHELPEESNALARVLNTRPVPLLQRNTQLPAELGVVVERSLARDPADRFKSAAQMRQALLRFATV